MKTICVTGGAGFIGSHLVDRCLDEGYEVRVIDNFSTGDERNLDDAETNITLREMDIRDYDQLVEFLDGVDWIFHQAALPSVPRSLDAPIESTDITLMGTVILLEAAREVDADRVVYASSSSVYGDQEELPKVEDMLPDPRSHYAAAKIASEYFARSATLNFSLDTIGLRYFNVFGPRQDPESEYAAVIPNFIRALLSGERPVIYGDGEQSRDFTFVDDVVEANFRAARNGESGSVYNVGYNRQMTINELLDHLQDILDTSIDPIYDDPRPGDVRHSRADASNLTRDTGFEPDRDMKEALERTVHWFRNHADRWEDPVYEN